jgi:hypothetical protein
LKLSKKLNLYTTKKNCTKKLSQKEVLYWMLF